MKKFFSKELQEDFIHNQLLERSKNMDLSGFTFIDLFAGIGGLRIPFDELNAKCVFSSEFDESAAKTYFDNFGELPSGDIKEIDEKIDIPPFDILLAGFPCQPFSNAGKKLGFKDLRGTLFGEDICRIIEFHKPKIIFLENVKGFMNHDDGNTFYVVKSKLEDLGYHVYSEVLNARDFNIPQNRERIFIIAIKKIKGSKIHYEFPQKINKSTLVGDILEENVDKKYTISDKLWEGHKRRRKNNKEKGLGFGYSLFDKSSPYTSTISARYYKDGSEILIDQKNLKKNPRKITPREAARLQGFPESFKISKSDNSAYKQFGNSVSVPVIRALAKNLCVPINELRKLEDINN